MPALNRVCVMLKRGDNGQYLDGMPICYIDEAEWGIPLETIISQYCSQVYLPVIVTRDFLLKYNEYISGVYTDGKQPKPDETKEAQYISSVKMDYSHLETSLGIDGLKDRIHSRESLGLIDGTRLGAVDWYDITTADKSPVTDLMTISSGSYTIGTAKNYATLNLFGADVTTLTGNLTGTIQTATTQTAVCTINNALAGYTLNITSDTDPLGVFASGRILTLNITGVARTLTMTNTSATPGGTVNVSKLNILTAGAPSDNYAMLNFISATTNVTVNLSDSLINLGGNISGAISLGAGTSNVVNVRNVVVTNGNKTTGSYGISLNTGTSTIVENVSIYSTKNGIRNIGNNAFTLKNAACFFNAIDYVYTASLTAGLGNTAATSCASSDTTGSAAGLRSLTAANEFQSLDVANAAFLKIRTDAATLDDAGTSPSLVANTYGIRGNARPASGSATYSIGADEVVQRVVAASAVSTFVPTTTSVAVENFIAASNVNLINLSTLSPGLEKFTAISNSQLLNLTTSSVGTSISGVISLIAANLLLIQASTSGTVTSSSSDTIRHKLIDAIVYGLGTIQTGNGYDITLNEINGTWKSFEQIQLFPCVNVNVEGEQYLNASMEGHSLGYLHKRMQCTLDIFLQVVEDMAGERDKVISSVEKYFANYYWIPGADTLPTCDINQIEQSSIWGIESTKSYGGLSIPLIIDYHQNILDPTLKTMATTVPSTAEDANTTVTISRRDNIREAILYQIEQISTTNGYTHTFYTDEDVLSVEQIAEFPFVDVIDMTEEYLNANSNTIHDLRIKKILHYEIDIYLNDINNTQEDTVIADIEKRFMNYPTLPDSDGKRTAFSCMFTECVPFGGDTNLPIHGVRFGLNVYYRQDITNPKVTA